MLAPPERNPLRSPTPSAARLQLHEDGAPRATRKPRQCTTDKRQRTAGRIAHMMAPQVRNHNVSLSEALRRERV